MKHKILAQYMDYYTKNFGDYIDVGDMKQLVIKMVKTINGGSILNSKEV